MYQSEHMTDRQVMQAACLRACVNPNLRTYIVDPQYPGDRMTLVAFDWDDRERTWKLHIDPEGYPTFRAIYDTHTERMGRLSRWHEYRGTLALEAWSAATD